MTPDGVKRRMRDAIRENIRPKPFYLPCWLWIKVVERVIANVVIEPVDIGCGGNEEEKAEIPQAVPHG